MAVGLVWLFVGCAPLLAASDHVVVISPHNASIRFEFDRAFAEWHQREFKQPATVEWRDVGGTAEVVRFVESEFKAKPDGIGIDVIFGGGTEPYLLLADRRLTERYQLPREVLEGLPAALNGVELYDPHYGWYGAALSSFGILQNTRAQRLLGLPQVRRWEELAAPALLGWVGIGDPRKSGTMNNMFEAFLQAYGWEQGWRLLTEIAANANRFDRFSSTTAKSVTLGETVYGFAIDFYGFSQIAVAGRTNMTFVLPADFTAISPDGIAILKGAPHPILARRFLDFTLGEPGQRLWFLPRGSSGGATRFSIERMSVRPDFYRRYREVSNIAFSPFDLHQSFHYNTQMARVRREVVAELAGALLVDTHPELQRAWRATIQRGRTPKDCSELGRVPLAEAEAVAWAAGPWKDPAFRTRQEIRWQTWAQAKYRRLAAQPASNTAGSGAGALALSVEPGF